MAAKVVADILPQCMADQAPFSSNNSSSSCTQQHSSSTLEGEEEQRGQKKAGPWDQGKKQRQRNHAQGEMEAEERDQIRRGG
jgi:hypothetical protein